MKYKILHSKRSVAINGKAQTLTISKSMDDFIKEVEDHIADGWELQGGVTISEVDVYIPLFAQAMIKKQLQEMDEIENKLYNNKHIFENF